MKRGEQPHSRYADGEKKEDVSRFLSVNVIYYIKEHGLYCS